MMGQTVFVKEKYGSDADKLLAELGCGGNLCVLIP
jgi:hypothetical protein